jgi:hypothetical protein
VGTVAIGKHYFVRHATMLLKFANSTTNPQLAAVLIEKAADRKLMKRARRRTQVL